MSNYKQSSVDFLIKSFQGAYGDKVTNVVSDLIEQAKAMHKEEMIIFAWNCHLKREMFKYQIEEKYNKTFGENNEQS